MNGSEHYKKAEELLRAAENDMIAGRAEGNILEHDQQVERAKVHATLAHTAVIVETDMAAVVEEENARTMHLVIEMLNEWGHQAASELLETNRDLFKKEAQ